MCGIVGFIGSGADKEKTLKDMMRKISHRGPDDYKTFISEEIAIGHLKLSIVDADSERQPMISFDQNLIITFDGEIYNHSEIKKDLESKGYIFKTNCDTEILLNGYHYYNKKILNKLRGMFSFIIWNIKEKELFGARDFFGVKPLYYYKYNGSFMFASEIKAFFSNKSFVKKFNKELLPNYLNFGFVPTKETFFKNVYSLNPGHYFIYRNNKLRIRKYFNINFEERLKTIEEFSSIIYKKVNDSIEIHKDKVDAGSFLTGEINSFVINYMVKPKHTFTLRYKNKKHDESKSIRNFVKKNILNNNVIYISKENYFNNLDDSIYYMDEPVSDPSVASIYIIFREVKKHVKVILSEEGVDEFFGGYNYYKQLFKYKLYNKIPSNIMNFVSKICKRFPYVADKNFFIKNGEIEEEYIGINKIFDDLECRKLLNGEYNNPNSKDLTKRVFKKVINKSNITKMQAIDINFYLVKDILLKTDKMGMASSVEVRLPFIDVEVFKIAKKLPEYAKVNVHNTKVAFRKAFENILGKRNSRKNKQNRVPLKNWMREKDIENIIKNEFNSEHSLKLFNNKYLNKLLKDFYSFKSNNYKKIWTIYVFLKWYKIFFYHCEI